MNDTTSPPNWLRRQCPTCGLFVTGIVHDGELVARHGCGVTMTAMATARRLLKPLFLRPVSPEERMACDAVAEEIEHLNKIIDDQCEAIGRSAPT